MKIITHIFLLVTIIIAGCEFTYKIKSGEEAYDVKQYAVAVQMLGEEFEQSTSPGERARKAYMTGLSYEQMNNPDQAAKWFGIASEDNYGVEAKVRYATNLSKLERYSEAIKVYQEIMTLSGDVMTLSLLMLPINSLITGELVIDLSSLLANFRQLIMPDEFSNKLKCSVKYSIMWM